jgi:hypothetical protein
VVCARRVFKEELGRGPDIRGIPQTVVAVRAGVLVQAEQGHCDQCHAYRCQAQIQQAGAQAFSAWSVLLSPVVLLRGSDEAWSLIMSVVMVRAVSRVCRGWFVGLYTAAR